MFRNGGVGNFGDGDDVGVFPRGRDDGVEERVIVELKDELFYVVRGMRKEGAWDGIVTWGGGRFSRLKGGIEFGSGDGAIE